jgi:formylmethanofuran dehydrogenase subunit E
MRDLPSLLSEASARHAHLCPRQVLGVRLGMAGPALVRLDAPRTDKALVVIVETDGCFADGVEVAAGVTIGHRTLRVVDYGKVAVTFVNVNTGSAVRLAPAPDVRRRALAYAPGETRHYYAQLEGYQHMPDQELFSMRPVTLTPSIEQIVGRAGVRVNCSVCGEEIINQREIIVGGQAFCPACLGRGYYQPKTEAPVVAQKLDGKPGRALRPAQPQVQVPGLLMDYGPGTV